MVLSLNILELLKNEINDITVPFFTFIKNFFQVKANENEFESNKILVNHQKTLKLENFLISNEDLMKITDDRFINKNIVIKNLVTLLALFCENCNQQFQVD